jgi:adenosylcobinamide-phosphate synthase
VKPDARVLLGAVSLDLVAGEPADRCHPVRWIGRVLDWADRRARSRTRARGAVFVVSIAAGAALVAAVVVTLARRTGQLGPLLEAVALKPAFSVRRLARAAAEVAAALDAGRLAEARTLVGHHLVSRPTAALGESEVASAAVESVAENLADSVAAPLLAYALGGLPAAWAYRALNTADAMWGYREPGYARFGMAAARLDDVANLVPARLAAAALIAAAPVAGGNGRDAAHVAWRDHARTASPNAGWPMSAMAGALGVGLTKPGAYHLGDRPLPDAPTVIPRALRLYGVASLLVVATAYAVARWRTAR